MRAGDSEFFDVAQGNAGIKQYELDLLKVFHGTVKGKTAAAKAARRVSPDGKNVIHELKAEGSKVGMGRYIWSTKRGVLVAPPRAARQGRGQLAQHRPVARRADVRRLRRHLDRLTLSARRAH